MSSVSKPGHSRAALRCNRRVPCRKQDPRRRLRRKCFMRKEPAGRSPLKVPEAMPPGRQVLAEAAEAVAVAVEAAGDNGT